MFARSLTFAAFASGAFFLPVAGTAPVTLKYKIAQKSEQTIDVSAMGQGEQKVNLGYIAFLTVTLNDSAGGRTVRAVVDSIAPDSGMMPQVSGPLSAAKGATGAGFVDPSGALQGFKQIGDTNSVRGNTLRGLVSSLFPKVKPTAKAGDSWTDTTETKDSTSGAPVTRRSVTAYKASAGAAKTVKIDLTGSYSLAGGGANGITFEGTGKSTGTFQRSSEGYIVDGSFNDNADLSLTIPQAPAPVPVANVSTITVTLLR
jgi:hypothetical protein